MSTPPRTFKTLTKAVDMERLRSAVSEVAKEGNVPSLSFPDALPPEPAGEGELPVAAADNMTSSRKTRSIRKAAPAPVKRVAVDLPLYLTKEISKRAAEDGVTKRFLYLKAFRAIDFAIQDVDMMEDGRREG